MSCANIDNSEQLKITDLRATLFWDTDLSELNFEEHADFIIGRVLDFGNLEEFSSIKKRYGMDKIREVAQRHPFPSKKHLPFASLLLDIPIDKLSCTRNHLLNLPNAFLMR